MTTPKYYYITLVLLTACHGNFLGTNCPSISAPPCNGSAMQIWSEEGDTACFSGTGFVDFRRYCARPWVNGFLCPLAWDNLVWSYEANDYDGYFIAANYDPITGQPLSSSYQQFYAGEYYPWPTTIEGRSYGMMISYNPLIR